MKAPWTHRIGVYVDQTLRRAVFKRAHTEEMSMSALIQVWIRRGLDGERVQEEER